MLASLGASKEMVVRETKISNEPIFVANPLWEACGDSLEGRLNADTALLVKLFLALSLDSLLFFGLGEKK